MTRNKSFVILFSLLTVCLSISCREDRSAERPTPVLSSPPSTTFPLPPIGGESLRDLGWTKVDSADKQGEITRSKLGDYQGKVIVLDMYATWCAPCRESIPHLIELQRRYQQNGLEIVGLNVGGPDDRVKVAGFAKELGINYALGFPDRALTDLLMSDDQSIPQTFVFNREGALVQRFIGYDEIGSGKLEELIKTETSGESR